MTLTDGAAALGDEAANAEAVVEMQLGVAAAAAAAIR